VTALFSTLKPQAPETLPQADQWQEHSACRSEDPALFFPDGTTGPWLTQIEEAKAVCRRCPVLETCLQGALDRNEPAGIWGGLTEPERARIRRRRYRKPTPVKALRTTQEKAREAYDTHTVELGGGHREWRGGPIRIDGVMHSEKQATWVAIRGERPTGALITQCGHKGCVTPAHQSQTRSTNGRKAA